MNVQKSDGSVEYIDHKTKISLQYPSNWSLDTTYLPSIRYAGENGFFQMDAGGTGSISIDEFASLNAHHKLNPYGTNPEITVVNIDNQDARLIKPSDDQPEEMKNQTCLIVKYPKPIKIGDTMYNFFIVYADSENIEAITETIHFIM
ncbi:hypothetical protein J23TS9_45090 [Paenibacillus sp. J23TS9]|uniref:hypothetical protein n=1 Tax=Paenibacillus sp. J23TS9 TaxID=2807193 RepID=UPI001B2C048F|nr:hypothetical protein [Paenibacillus sp. J23TS9]GIP29379.1 hypothetical protein J23TS9_45090 [Paenibacillus sp. J23TS9]